MPKPKYDKYEKKGKQKKGTSATSHNDAPEATVEVKMLSNGEGDTSMSISDACKMLGLSGQGISQVVGS